MEQTNFVRLRVNIHNMSVEAAAGTVVKTALLNVCSVEIFDTTSCDPSCLVNHYLAEHQVSV